MSWKFKCGAPSLTFSIKELEDWANLGGASSRDAILKRRIKTVLPAPPLLATRESERR